MDMDMGGGMGGGDIAAGGAVIGAGAVAIGAGAAVTGVGAVVTGAGAVVTGAAAIGAAVIGAAVTGEVTQAATFEDDSLEQSGALAAECTPTNFGILTIYGNVPGHPGTSCLRRPAYPLRLGPFECIWQNKPRKDRSE
jgi:hypothetical protein